MSGPKKFIQDRIVLLLITVNSFLVTVSVALIVLRLGTSTHSQGLIGEYRSNLGTFGGFRHGDVYTFVSFIVFIAAVFIFHAVLARRVYYIRRQFALAVLGMGSLLILLAAIVSNSLLNI
jgi:hypothetical protein